MYKIINHFSTKELHSLIISEAINMYIRRTISSRVIYMQIEIQVIHYKVNIKGNEFQKLFSIQITLDFSK